VFIARSCDNSTFDLAPAVSVMKWCEPASKHIANALAQEMLKRTEKIRSLSEGDAVKVKLFICSTKMILKPLSN
jgi:hypothetical protein